MAALKDATTIFIYVTQRYWEIRKVGTAEFTSLASFGY